MFSEIIKKNRTKRVYDGGNVDFDTLIKIIDDCRYSASSNNRQDIRYILVNDSKMCNNIFAITNLPTTHKIPVENRPGAFI